jgi:zinc protease
MIKSVQRIQPPVHPVLKVVIPEVKSLNLKNGIPVFSIEAGTEDIMRMEIIFRAGQVRESMPLLASTTNLMLSEGSQSYTSEEINRLLDYYGAFINLNPEKDLAGVVLYFLNKHTDKVLELAHEIIFKPLFPEKELNNLMQKRLRWYLVNREKSANKAMDQFFESAFGRLHPYGRQLQENDFEKINTGIIKEFYSRYYTPDNMAIIISGKLHPKTIDLLNKYFGETQAMKSPKSDHENILRPDALKEVHLVKNDAVQTAIRIGSPTINKRHPDYPGLKILNNILGGYFGSRLMKNIREEKGFTYGINSSVTSLDLTGYKLISTEVSPKNCSETIDEIFSEIIKLQSTKVGTQELELVRNYMSGEMVRIFDGPFAIAESFRSVWEFGMENEYYSRLTEKILKISPDEIIELAGTYYKIDELYRVTVGPE